MIRLIGIAIIFIVLPLSTRAELRNPDYVQVYIVPMNDFPEPLAVQLAEALSKDLGLWIKSSLRIGRLDIELMPGTNQLPGEDILAKSQAIIRSFPEGSKNTYFLLLTLSDINSKTNGFRYQFSMHNKELNTSVLSLARLFDYQGNQPIFNNLAISRLFKMSKRAIGELHLGWERSTDPNDVMYSPLMGLTDLDRIGTGHIDSKKKPDPVKSKKTGVI